MKSDDFIVDSSLTACSYVNQEFLGRIDTQQARVSRSGKCASQRVDALLMLMTTLACAMNWKLRSVFLTLRPGNHKYVTLNITSLI
jgi:hypothetical protein